jgi:hypothetical protein
MANRFARETAVYRLTRSRPGRPGRYCPIQRRAIVAQIHSELAWHHAACAIGRVNPDEGMGPIMGYMLDCALRYCF